MQIVINRHESTDDGTRSDLKVVETGFTCKALDLPWRNNEKGKSSIIADTYKAVIWYSPTFKMNVIRLENKHGRSDCLIHYGNWAGDVDKNKYSDVRGCTLVGTGYDSIKNPKGQLQLGILKSRKTLMELIENIGIGPHEVVYTNAN